MLWFSSLLKNMLPEFFLQFDQVLNYHGIGYRLLENTCDIWCRDYMPVRTTSGKFLMFQLAPDYYKPGEEHRRTDTERVCREIGIQCNPAMINGEVVRLDGGSIVMGYGTAFITEKVLRDNGNIDRDLLANFLTGLLELERMIFLPNEPGDYTGHADGMVRIVGPATVLLNDYAAAGYGKRFCDSITGILRNTGFEIVPVPYFPVNSKAYDQPATGCYINYLQVEELVFLPTFNNRNHDKQALDRFGRIFGKENVVAVPSRSLAELGGVLNCISWEDRNS